MVSRFCVLVGVCGLLLVVCCCLVSFVLNPCVSNCVLFAVFFLDI